jgi:hypothetical protein
MKVPNIPIKALINYGFQYVIDTSIKYKIDESHALKHSMEVFGLSKNMYDIEVVRHPYLENQQDIIFMAAIGHDMCDKKYMDENEGIAIYTNYLSEYMDTDKVEIVGKIIGTMSYSKVKIKGFPELGDYQLAYNIVREADLLAAYDIDRCIMYSMYSNHIEYTEALKVAIELFHVRVFQMKKDKLFTIDYSKKLSIQLHKKAQKDVNCLQKLLD